MKNSRFNGNGFGTTGSIFAIDFLWNTKRPFNLMYQDPKASGLLGSDALHKKLNFTTLLARSSQPEESGFYAFNTL